MPQRKMVLSGFMGLLLLVFMLPATMPVLSPLPAATALPPGSPSPTQAGPTPGAPPLSLTFTMLFTCCSLGLVVGLIVLGFIVSLQKRKIEQPEKSE